MYRNLKKYNIGCAILCIFFPTIQISYLGIKCINLEPKTLVAFRRHESEATKWHLFGFFVRHVGTEIEIEACFAGIESAANVEKKIEGKKDTTKPEWQEIFAVLQHLKSIAAK